MKGYDQTSNLILADAVERIYSLDEPVEEAPLGLYIIRGDNMCELSESAVSFRLTRVSTLRSVLVGEMDAQAESKLDFNSIRADPLDEIHF